MFAIKKKKKTKEKKAAGHISPFREYTETLTDAQRLMLEKYFKLLDQQILLPNPESRLLISDFKKSLLYYSHAEVPLEEALSRLNPDNLGGFYCRPAHLWYPLDDAAKIYPLAMKNKQMSIFRLSAYLNEDIIPEILQTALTFTIKRFPFFATTIKKGFFWHYIDSTKKRFPISQENCLPCQRINVSVTGAQSFRVIYYKNRISVEFFHILTDGTGGMIFLKTLVAEYLRLLGVKITCENGILDIHATPTADECSNDFPKATPVKKASGFVDKPALQMSGKLSSAKPCRVLHFELDSSSLKAAAKAKGCTISAFILALMFVAGKAATDETRGSIHIQVPVNMRSFYKSNTLRNFSQYCSVRLPITEVSSVDELLPEIKNQLAENASKEAMNEMMNATVKMVHSLRFVPLFIKRPAALIAYGFLGDKVFSNTLSNLGVIQIPEEMRPYVTKMDFVLGTSITNRAACSMLTLGDTTSLSIAKLTADPSFENKLYSLFEENGITPIVKGSELFGN